jgi:DNA-binding IclR family transcriptional regulator
MKTEDSPNIPVKSVVRMFDVIRVLKERNGATLTEIHDELNASKSTVFNHLATLENRGYVVLEDDEYNVGLRFLDYGGHALTRDPRLQFIEPKVRKIAQEVGELCQFMVEEHGKAVVVFRQEGANAVETKVRIGSRFYLNHSTAGKAILASISDGRIWEILDRHGLPPKTANTITDEETLFAEIEQIREQGYVFDREEHIEGLHAISVSVIDDNRVLGAFSVAGPSHRLDNPEATEEIIDLLLGIANELELNLEFHG